MVFREGMQDPIITLRNIFLAPPPLTDTAGNPVEVFPYYNQTILSGHKRVWVAIGEPSGTTPRDTWLSLRGMGHRYWRSWRYPVYVGGWDIESINKVARDIAKKIRDEATNHSAPPEYIEFMFVENWGGFEQEEEDVSPPLIITIVNIVVEYIEI
jgi:hypothetical protein